MTKSPASIDAYLATVPADRRRALEQLRTTIHSLLPGVEECISYSMPAFRYAGKVVAGFQATGKGCSYYPFSGTTLATLSAELGEHEQTKSALHFSSKTGLSPALARKLLVARLAEIDERLPSGRSGAKPKTAPSRPADAKPKTGTSRRADAKPKTAPSRPAGAKPKTARRPKRAK